MAPPWSVFTIGMITVRSGSASRVTLTCTLLALGHGVGRLLEAHGHRRHVVVGDGDGRLVDGPCADARGQRGPKAQLHALTESAAAVKVKVCSVSPLVDGLGHVWSSRRQVAPPWSVAVRGMVTVRSGSAFEGHLDLYAAPLGHGVGRLPKAHRHRRHIVVGDGDGRLVRICLC